MEIITTRYSTRMETRSQQLWFEFQSTTSWNLYSQYDSTQESKLSKFTRIHWATSGIKSRSQIFIFSKQFSIVKKWSAFFSSEIDLYENVRDTVSITPKLTSIYANLRYRPSRKINFQLGYDNRQNVVYYESYKHQIDQLLDQATRQGLRFSVQYNVLKSISVNASSFLRFQSNQSEFSKTI